MRRALRLVIRLGPSRWSSSPPLATLRGLLQQRGMSGGAVKKIGVPTVVSSNFQGIELSEARFHEVSEQTLESIMNLLAPLESELDDDVDISYSQGVLNMNLGKHGFWVINKQTPNRQLWWSSPLSGPRRYEFHDTGGGGRIEEWKGTADQKDMLGLLISEILTVTGVNLLERS